MGRFFLLGWFLVCLVFSPLQSTKAARRHGEQQHIGAEALLPGPHHSSCLPAGCTPRNRWSLQVMAPPDSQHAAKAKAAETNNVRFNGKKEFHTEEAKPRLARGNTNKLWSTTTASQHKRAFLQGGSGLPPYREGGIIAPCL